jgi:hypothetical protein
MVEEVKHFMCFKHELERINEGLILRGTDASSVINITDNGDEVVVWYKFKNKQYMKQTAVECLEDELNQIKSSSTDMNSTVKFLEIEFKELFEQAKEMEKQQIIDAYIEGYSAPENLGDSEQYYNEEFNK